MQAYYHVVLPVSGPGLVAGGAFTFMLCWNEFVVALVLNTKLGSTTLPPVIAGMNGQINIDYSVIAASGNAFLMLAAQPLFTILQTSLSRSSLGARFHRGINDQHRAIAAAIETGEARRAEREMRSHLQFLRPHYERTWRYAIRAAEQA